MRNKTVFFYILIPTYLFVVYFLINSSGGIDLKSYRNVSNAGFFYWDFYQLKEVVSWFLIKLSFQISSLVGFKQPTFILSLTMFLIMSLSTQKMVVSRLLLPLILISPFSVLLSLNILRQYISVVFFCLAIVYYIERNGFYFLLFSILAIFSHNSILVLVPFICLSRYLNIYVLVIPLFFLSILIIPLSKILDVNLMVSDYNEGGSVSVELKALVHFIYVAVLYFFVSIKYRCFNFNASNNELIVNIINILFFLMIFIFFMPFPAWISNRYLISIGFIYLFFIFGYNANYSTKNKKLLLLFIVFVNIMSVFAHGGALSMLSI